jgi:hypothetical protein
VKLLDRMLHGVAHQPGEQVVLLSQVLAADINIGYEDMLNTQVGLRRWRAPPGCTPGRWC